jgi:hypothetical protein
MIGSSAHKKMRVLSYLSGRTASIKLEHHLLQEWTISLGLLTLRLTLTSNLGYISSPSLWSKRLIYFQIVTFNTSTTSSYSKVTLNFLSRAALNFTKIFQLMEVIPSISDIPVFSPLLLEFLNINHHSMMQPFK